MRFHVQTAPERIRPIERNFLVSGCNDSAIFSSIKREFDCRLAGPALSIPRWRRKLAAIAHSNPPDTLFTSFYLSFLFLSLSIILFSLFLSLSRVGVREATLSGFPLHRRRPGLHAISFLQADRWNLHFGFQER